MPYTINGQPQNFAEPKLIDGTTYVPLGNIVDTLGGYVTWDNYTKVASIELGDHKARVQSDSTTVEADGDQVELQAPPYIEGNALWVPVRFFQSALKCNIAIDGDKIEISRSP
jgi:hypothetical protein